jgi:putative NADH-flavin reductase
MKLILFGATGQIGRQTLTQALERGHTVTAFVRDAAKLDVTHPNLTVVAADARDARAVAAAIPGHDAVINAMGPGGPGVSDQFLDILTEGSRHIAEAMQKTGIKRLVALGSAGTLQATPTQLLRDMPNFPAFTRNISGAHLQAWKTYEAAGLEWTMVCPPGAVEPGDRTGNYRFSADYMVEMGAMLKITTGDLADLVLNAVEQGKYLGHRVSIAY